MPHGAQRETPAAAASTPRRTSTRARTASHATTSNTRGFSGRSVIVHDDIDEDDGEEPPEEAYVASQTNAVEAAKEPIPAPKSPATRMRKANDTQRRLGVGRPVIAGGSGARAVTKSISIPKARRGKSSRSIKPIEATIEEGAPSLIQSLIFLIKRTEKEPSPPPIVNSCEVVIETPPPRSRSHRHDSHTTPSHRASETDSSLLARLNRMEATLGSDSERDNVRNQLNVLNILPGQLDSLKHLFNGQIEEISNLRSDVNALRTEIMTLQALASKVPALEDELRSLRETVTQAVSREAGSAVKPAVKPAAPTNARSAMSPNPRYVS